MKLVDSGHSQYAYQALNFPSTTQIENKLQFNKWQAPFGTIKMSSCIKILMEFLGQPEPVQDLIHA